MTGRSRRAEPAKFDAARAAETMFLPLADPGRRDLKPMRALEAAHDLRVMMAIAELGAVRRARASGRTWAEIGEALGTTRQGAHDRFAVLVQLAEAGPTLDVAQAVEAIAQEPRARRAPANEGGRQQRKARRRPRA